MSRDQGLGRTAGGAARQRPRLQKSATKRNFFKKKRSKKNSRAFFFKTGEYNGDPKNNLAESEGWKTGKIDPKSTGNSQNGPWKGRKRPLGLFRPFQGMGKTGRSLKGFPKGFEGIVEGIGRRLGSCWGVSGHGRPILAVFSAFGVYFACFPAFRILLSYFWGPHNTPPS